MGVWHTGDRLTAGADPRARRAGDRRGGAGLRAASRRRRGPLVGLVCSPCWGRRNSDGGRRNRRRAGQVDERDSWKVHFAKPCAAASTQLCRMASCSAGSAGAGRELEAWGALFDRPRRPILQRQLRGTLTAAGPRRRSHRAGDDPPLQDHGIHQDRRAHGDTVLSLLKDASGSRRFGYDRERGLFPSSRPRWCSHRRHRKGVPDQATPGVQRRRHVLAYDAGAS